ncbi:MAG: energy transducer TonB [Bryobacteraceae bacterium]
MKTVTSETLSSSINTSESPGRVQESPERALGLLDQANRVSGPAPVGTAGAQSFSLEREIILSPGLGAPPRTWRSQITSVSIHALIIALLLLITFPVVQEIKHPTERFTLIAPRLNPYKPKLPRLHIQPRQIVKTFVAPQPIIKPPPVKVMPPAPVLKPPTPVASVQPLPKIEAPEPPPAPKPQIRTGVFETADLAKAAQGAKQLKTGGFGDPHGVPATAQNTSPMMMAKLGGFDLPNGEAKGGAAGRSIVQGGFGGIDAGTSSGTGHKGSVRSSGFGDSAGTGSGAGTGNGHAGSIRTSGFGDTAAQAPAGVQRAATQPATTNTEILFKPKPVYTPEARNLKVEGQVALEVVFQASGTVRVIRVVHGLGHGLDEAAEQAAQQVRFRPATRGGVAVDTNATLYITFQLT